LACLARQQRFKLAPRRLGLERLERVLGLANDPLILLGIAEFDHRDLVVDLALDSTDGIELVVERVALLHHALRARRIVPEAGVLGLLIKFGQPCLGPVEVKDASSAAQSTA
jgi:hypothetical protein